LPFIEKSITGNNFIAIGNKYSEEKIDVNNPIIKTVISIDDVKQVTLKGVSAS